MGIRLTQGMPASCGRGGLITAGDTTCCGYRSEGDTHLFKIGRVYPLNLINLDHKDLQEGALTAVRPNFLVQEIKIRVGEPSQGNNEESLHKQGTQDSKESFNVQKKALKQVDLAVVREQITNLVGNRALEMVETTMDEVDKATIWQ
jgi:hypothetical protein